MNQIVADRMAPVLTIVFRRIGLIEQVPAAFPEVEPVRIAVSFRADVVIDGKVSAPSWSGRNLAAAGLS